MVVRHVLCHALTELGLARGDVRMPSEFIFRDFYSRNPYPGIPISESHIKTWRGHDVCLATDCGRGMLGEHVATGNAPEIPLNL